MEMQNEKKLPIAVEKVRDPAKKIIAFLTAKKIKIAKRICCTCRRQAG